MADEVPHDEEVGREPHLRDDAELVVEPRALTAAGNGVAVALDGAARREVGEVGGRRLLVGADDELVGHRELRQRRLAELDLDVGALGDEERVVARLGQVAEERPHLGGGLQVVLGALELEPLRVV